MNGSAKRTEQPVNASLGIGFTLLSILLFGVQDVCAKLLVQDYPVPQVVMLRLWAFGGFAVFLALRQHGFAKIFHSNRPGIQFLRAFVFFADLLLFATGLRTLPLGEAASITLMFPIFVTIIAIPVLGEKVGRLRWFSVFLGFAGVLIVLRPGLAVFNIGAVFVLAATLLFAFYVVLTRLVSRDDPTATSMLYVGGVGMVVSSFVGLMVWVGPTPGAWGLIALLMLATSLANYFVMKALSFAPASVVQPYNYLLLPWAIFLGLVVFGQGIDLLALLGALVIVGSGIMVWMRERRPS